MRPRYLTVILAAGLVIATPGTGIADGTPDRGTTGLRGGAAAGVDDPMVPGELRVRDGLPNVMAKLKGGEPVRIAYLGGSITAAGGWRPKSAEWFQSQHPKARVLQINAAISGTGSDFGACRIATDVLARHPDLVFMEHRVNGGGGYEAKSVEGIVRQIWRNNPRTDICLVYTVSEGMLKDLQAGKTPWFGAIMETIAKAYGIPSIDLGVEVAKRAKAGEHTAVLRVKTLPDGLSFYAGQVLVIGAVRP